MSTTRAMPSGRRRATLAAVAVGAAATATFVGTSALPATAAGCVELTPPQITSFSFAPGSVDVRSGEKKVKVTAHVTDTEGAELVMATFESPTGPGGKSSFAAAHLKLSSGTAKDGTFTGEAIVARGVIPGAWKVRSVSATDVQGGSGFLSYEQLGQKGWKRDLAVKSTPDLKKPAITALTVAPTKVNTKAKAARVKVTAKATDNMSGVAFVAVELTRKTKGATGTPATLVVLKRTSGTANNGSYVGYADIPRWVGTDSWLVSADTMDAAMNQTEYSNAAVAKKKWSRSVSVVSNNDTTMPALVSATPSPTTISAATAVSVTARATDAQSGVASVLVTWEGDGGSLTVPLTRTGGTPQNGTWTGKGNVFRCLNGSGTWTATAMLTDVAGNVHKYTAEETAAMGIGTLTVKEEPGASSTYPDSQSDVVPDTSYDYEDYVAIEQ
ncbi:hypothetical protein [Motilibacter deserti]|uniref:Ig-like domain-containing protein n=1 Tax=Motilibacter deserti TaxID=2714956 RepID=A0ABX0GZ84_9ACTN|nr:hypothetical protein [Motilibacter deserti]NHC16288.1 hypothetical protein [Motilibacter deserti]